MTVLLIVLLPLPVFVTLEVIEGVLVAEFVRDAVWLELAPGECVAVSDCVMLLVILGEIVRDAVSDCVEVIDADTVAEVVTLTLMLRLGVAAADGVTDCDLGTSLRARLP